MLPQGRELHCAQAGVVRSLTFSAAVGAGLYCKTCMRICDFSSLDRPSGSSYGAKKFTFFPTVHLPSLLYSLFMLPLFRLHLLNCTDIQYRELHWPCTQVVLTATSSTAESQWEFSSRHAGCVFRVGYNRVSCLKGHLMIHS